MAATLLVTGFERFGPHLENPSELVVRALAADEQTDLHTEVLPVAFGAAEARLEALLTELEPAAVLLLGLAEGDGIRLERQAWNVDDAGLADNAGERREACTIDPEGPITYPTTLPLERLAACLEGAGVPLAHSNDAGGFLCNHVFYVARRHCEPRSPAPPCGFVHLPPTTRLPLSLQIEAVRRLLAELRRTL